LERIENGVIPHGRVEDILTLKKTRVLLPHLTKGLQMEKIFDVIPHSEVGDKPERGIGETHSAIGACLRRQGSDSVGSAATLNDL